MPRNRYDFNRPFCEVCGKTGGWYTQDGWQTCEEHWRSPKPEKPVFDSHSGGRIENEANESRGSFEAEGIQNEK